MPAQTWAQNLAFGIALPATDVTNTASITALVPDITIPANYMYIGKVFKAEIYGKISTAASTPGTATFQAMWGGTGGTSLATSGALTLVAAATNIPFRLEYLITCTAASTLFAQGQFQTYVSVLATPGIALIPASAPAAVGSLTFTSAQALDFNVTCSSAQAGNHVVVDGYTLMDLC